MKAIDLHNGIKRAIQGIQQPIAQCTPCRQAPVARFHTSFAIPSRTRTFSSSSIRRAEDEPPRTTTSDARLADTNVSADVSSRGGLENAPAFTPAPEIDLDNVDFKTTLDLASSETSGQSAPKVTETLKSKRTRLNPPRPLQTKQVARLSPGQEAALLNKVRVVPASPSYFTSRPNFTDHYLEVSALYRRHLLLPTGGRSETKIKWLSLPEYKAVIGDEPVAAGRFRELITMCGRLSSINPHLMPDEVNVALQRFMKEEQPVVKYMKKHVVDDVGRAYGLGRRKSATARAWIVKGEGDMLVNGKSLSQYFSRIHQRESAIYALSVTERVGNYNVFGVVQGGGNTGQAEALTLAVAKALLVYEPSLKERLRFAGCLTRDRRKVERKKPGHLKARKKPAWVKR